MSAETDLPDGTFVQARVEGYLRTAYGSGKRWIYDCGVWLESCVPGSIEPVRVVPKPGRWYADSHGMPWFGLPGGRVSCWLGDDWGACRSVSDSLGLVECDPPAEFRATP